MFIFVFVIYQVIARMIGTTGMLSIALGVVVGLKYMNKAR